MSYDAWKTRTPEDDAPVARDDSRCLTCGGPLSVNQEPGSQCEDCLEFEPSDHGSFEDDLRDEDLARGESDYEDRP